MTGRRPGPAAATLLGLLAATADPLGPAPVEVRRLRPGDGPDEPPPPWLPAVTVAVRPGPVDDRPAGADVALTDQTGAPAPWVTVADPDAAAAALAARVAAHPAAAVTLVQVLRLGVGLEPAAALVLESLAYSLLQAGADHRGWLAARPAGRPGTDPGPTVRVERRGDTLVVTLDRPERRNAVNAALRHELAEALEVAVADPVLAVELRGTGPSFSSGGDLDEFGTAPDPPDAHRLRLARHPALRLAVVGPRTTAHLHGACMGAGVELAAWAARVVAAADTTVSLPELDMGLVPGAGGTVSLPRRLGRHRAAWLALHGGPVDADRARSLGLVDRVEPGR